jgi:hypothetical protein
MRFMRFESTGKYIRIDAIAWIQFEENLARVHLLNSAIVTFTGNEANELIDKIADLAI